MNTKWEEDLAKTLMEITAKYQTWNYAMNLYSPLKEFISKQISEAEKRGFDLGVELKEKGLDKAIEAIQDNKASSDIPEEKCWCGEPVHKSHTKEELHNVSPFVCTCKNCIHITQELMTERLSEEPKVTTDAESVAKQAQQEENYQWIAGRRCTSCGVEKEADLADWCGKCFEEN